MGWVFRGNALYPSQSESEVLSHKSQRGGASAGYEGRNSIESSPGQRSVSEGKRVTGWTTDSGVDIAELGEQFKDAWDPIERARLFDQLISQLTAENAEEMRTYVQGLRSDSAEFINFHFAWGKIAGPDAMTFGINSKEYDGGHIFKGWASANPEEAQAWLEGLDFNNDPAFENLRNRGATSERLTRLLRQKLIEGLYLNEPRKAASYISSLPEDQSNFARDQAENLVRDIITRNGIEAAQNWVSHLPVGKVSSDAVGEIADEWSEVDPEAALEWAMTHQNEEVRQDALFNVWRNMASGEAGSDPFQVAERINAMPASSDKDFALYGFASGTRRQFPESSIEAAASISDPELRERSVIRSAASFLRSNPTQAREWIESSGLPQQTVDQIRRYSRNIGR